MKKWTIIFTIGQLIDKAVLVLALIAAVMIIVGWIIDALWVDSASTVLVWTVVYSIIWFIASFFIHPRMKKE